MDLIENEIFSVGNEIGRNVIIFGVDMSSFPHINNKKKDNLILGKGPTQGLEHTLTAEKLYSINFTANDKKFCLSLHHNGVNSYLFVNGIVVVKFKARDSETVAYPLCLGNISKDFSDYDAIAKNINVEVFNLMSRTNEARHIEWHETCKCKCRLDASACNNKQSWNNDKCKCECRTLIDKGMCDKWFIWNPSNFECECDKSCDVAEYLDHENCKCRKR